MQFSEIFQNNPYFLYDGPMETRIEYDTHLTLDKEMSIFRLLETREGRDALAWLYRTDIKTVMPFNIPIILNAPTFRASKAHCQRLGIAANRNAIYSINQECIEFVNALRNEYPDFKDKILITAPVGPKYAGFTPDEYQDLAKEVNYHAEQINSIAQIGVDVISIAAMPGGLEAIGAAVAASKTHVDYTVGFVINAEGTLLDGTPIATVIREIDTQTHPNPIGYIISCTHPTTAKSALIEAKPEYKRIIGIKANGSAKPPKALLTLKKAEADVPKIFAKELIDLGSPFGFKIYGGCCGTNHLHLKALAEALSK